MDINNITALNTNISRVEYKKISDSLLHFDIEPEKVIKQNEHYIITAVTSTYCLRKIDSSHRKAFVTFQLCEYLFKNGFINTPYPIKTKEGSDLLKYNNSYYYLTDFIDGRIGSYNNYADTKNISMLLAKFHLNAQGFYNKNIEMHYKEYRPLSKQEKYLESFKTIEEIIENKKIKTMFDSLYLQSLEFFMDQLVKSVNLFSTSNYIRLLQNSRLKHTLCLDNFRFRNILVSNNGEYYLTSLTDAKYNIVVYDLCKYIKKILNNKTFSWDFKYARGIIDSYCKVNPLSKDELKILLSLIIFPKDFYKLGKMKYIKRKKTDENKYLSKLLSLTNYLDNKRDFVEEYLNFYSL